MIGATELRRRVATWLAPELEMQSASGIDLRQARAATPAHKPLRIPAELLARSAGFTHKPILDHLIKDKNAVFAPARPPPGVVPKGATMAMDDAPPAMGWATNALGNGYGGFGYDGFIGYAELAFLAQRPEYRRISETVATEATRKWIRYRSVSEKKATTEKIKQLQDAETRFNLQQAFRKMSEYDGFMGRSHLYMDFDGAFKDRDELKTPIGNGRDKISAAKIKKGSLKYIHPVEAVWCYPTRHNSNDPLSQEWYNPDSWFVQGKELHRSRFLTFIAREVPDLLKPAYSFGGLSMSQMAIPYVNNWLKTRTSVNAIISAFSVFVLATNLSESVQQDGQLLFDRIALWNNFRDNSGTMVIDKETEDFLNVAVPLGTLDVLQAQAQEHMAAVSGIPLVKLLGIQPAGLNASSEGEIRTFYDNIAAYQEKFFRPHLTTVLNFIQLSEFGEVDEDITFDFEPLWSLDEKGEAEVRKTKAETAMVYVDGGVFSQKEVRGVEIRDADSPWTGLAPEDVPDAEEEGVEPGNVRERIDEGGEIEQREAA